jgi:hypothetical protein
VVSRAGSTNYQPKILAQGEHRHSKLLQESFLQNCAPKKQKT